MKEKNSASTKKKILWVLLKSAYFISGFILAMAISYCRTTGFYVDSNTIEATDLPR